MDLVFFGKGDRGLCCLKELLESQHRILLGFVQVSQDGTTEAQIALLESAGIPVLSGKQITKEQKNTLSRTPANVFLLCGFGIILPPDVLEMTDLVLNLHGGTLPKYRGSSPLNWALIRGETEFGISVLKVTENIDDGEIMAEETFSIGKNDTIVDLHRKVNDTFPELMLSVLNRFEVGGIDQEGRRQQGKDAIYFHQRFPDDGEIYWETTNADNLLNLIRALAPPYPCARSYLGTREVRFLEASRTKVQMVGHPGRVYQVSDKNGILVGTIDWCIWINRWEFVDLSGGDALKNQVWKYARFSSRPTIG